MNFLIADQRGIARPQWTSSADSGAVEVALPPPWENQDVGAVRVAGNASNSGGSFRVLGSGVAIYGLSDQFHFVYRILSGDGQIVARVATVQNTNVNSKAGVMIRESLSANSANVMMSIRPYAGAATFQYRTATGGGSGAEALSAAQPIWFKLVRSANTFTGYRSSNGTTWTRAGSVTIPMASTIYFGLAVSSYDNSRLCTSTFDNVAAVP